MKLLPFCAERGVISGDSIKGVFGIACLLVSANLADSRRPPQVHDDIYFSAGENDVNVRGTVVVGADRKIQFPVLQSKNNPTVRLI